MDLADFVTVAGVIVATIGAALMFGIPAAVLALGLVLLAGGLYMAAMGVRR